VVHPCSIVTIRVKYQSQKLMFFVKSRVIMITIMEFSQAYIILDIKDLNRKKVHMQSFITTLRFHVVARGPPLYLPDLLIWS
jgi:hypothetical protein